MNQIKFTSDECSQIIALSNVYQKHSSEEWWEGNNTMYHAWHIERNEKTDWIFERLLNYLTQNTNIILVENLNLIHLQNVQPGNKFEPHVDKRSEFNIGACLNKNYEGGELICYDPKIILPKIEGAIYTFPGNKVHEVKEVTSGERWSLISFLEKKMIKIKHTII